MMELFEPLLQFLVICMIHEIGHYAHAKAMGFKNVIMKIWKIGPVPIGLQTGYSQSCLIWAKMSNVVMGILAGLVALSFINPSCGIWQAYWIACAVDITMLYVLMEKGFKEGFRSPVCPSCHGDAPKSLKSAE